MSIFKFIQKDGYNGSYSLLADYSNKHKCEQIKKATLRYETSPRTSSTSRLERKLKNGF